MTATRFFYPESLSNHPTVYVTTSSSLKAIVHDLLYSEMLRERNSSPSWKVSQKIFRATCGDPASASSAPPYLPTSSYATVLHYINTTAYAPFPPSINWEAGNSTCIWGYIPNSEPKTCYKCLTISPATFLPGKPYSSHCGPQLLVTDQNRWSLPEGTAIHTALTNCTTALYRHLV